MNATSTKNSFERWLNDNPPLSSEIYLAYVAEGGTCWGHNFRKHHLAQFNKSYEEMWCKNPQLWASETEL